MELTPTQRRIDQMLAAAPYQRISTTPVGQADPVALFRGSPATMADLAERWTIPRDLRDGDNIIPFGDFQREFAISGQGTVYLLHAPAGEGKTTFLRQLAYSLQPNTHTLQWKQERLNEDRLDILQDIVNEKISGILVGELPPNTSPSIVTQLCRRLDSQPLPVPLLLTVPPDARRSCSIVRARHLRFAPLRVQLAQQLADQLKRLFHSGQYGEDRLDLDLPYLRSFAGNPKIEVFTKGEGPLFLGMLEATYGTNFRERLRDEYRDLSGSNGSQAAYKYISYVGVAQLGMPLELLAKLVPGVGGGLPPQLVDRAPWLLDPDGGQPTLKARNRLIAEIVLLEAGLLYSAGFSQFVRELLSATMPPTLGTLDFVYAVLRAYTLWQPVTPATGGANPGSVRNSLRRTLLTHDAWLASARGLAANALDWGPIGGWSSLMYHLLPYKQVLVTPTNQKLLAEGQAWLDLAKLRFPREYQPQITYWEGKRELLAGGSGQDLQTRRASVLFKWEAIRRDSTLSADFFSDLATTADVHAAEETTASSRQHWFVVAAESYQELLSRFGSQERWVSVAYSELLSLAHYRLGEAEFREILEQCWKLSLAANRPNALTGTWLAQLTAKSDPDRAVGILKTVLAYSRWGEALLTLAHMGGEDIGLAEFVIEYCWRHQIPEEWRAPLNIALARHALAVARAAQGEGDRQLLSDACAAYKEAADVGVRRMWQIYGDDYWLRAIDLLSKTDSQASAVARKDWRAAKKQYETRQKAKTRTGQVAKESGIYRSDCTTPSHREDVAIGKGAVFPACRFCPEQVNWTLIAVRR